jgi:ribokinase
VIASAVHTAAGGKGANQASAAGRLGPGVHMVGRVGDDDAGARMLQALSGAGVDVTHCTRTPGAPTGTATIPVEHGSGENLILVVPGANARLEPDDVDLACVRDADVLLLQLEVPLVTVAAAAGLARGRVVLNPAPSQLLPDHLLASVDVLVPNEHELVQLSGDAPSGAPFDLADVVRRATELRGRCAPGAAVVVTLGSRGALLVTEDATALLQAPPPVDAVDATGAGDCFCGALSSALAAGDDLAAAVRYAVAAASASTTGPGARSAQPTDAAVRDLLARLPEAVAAG